MPSILYKGVCQVREVREKSANLHKKVEEGRETSFENSQLYKKYQNIDKFQKIITESLGKVENSQGRVREFPV